MSKKYTFIHPTKCGGTACEECFKQYYNQYIVGWGHNNICSNSNNPIIIVRDVKSRFISMFKYWKSGSINWSFQRNKNFINENKDSSILDFILILKTNKKKLYGPFLGHHHFANTSYWIGNTEYKNIIVIKYVPDLNEKIKILLNILNIPNKNILIPKINISKTIDKDVELFEKYNTQIDEFIEIYFNKDIKLINMIEKTPEIFKLVI